MVIWTEPKIIMKIGTIENKGWMFRGKPFNNTKRVLDVKNFDKP